jgi:hypothetical protein
MPLQHCQSFRLVYAADLADEIQLVPRHCDPGHPSYTKPRAHAGRSFVAFLFTARHFAHDFHVLIESGAECSSQSSAAH